MSGRLGAYSLYGRDSQIFRIPVVKPWTSRRALILYYPQPQSIFGRHSVPSPLTVTDSRPTGTSDPDNVLLDKRTTPMTECGVLCVCSEGPDTTPDRRRRTHPGCPLCWSRTTRPGTFVSLRGSCLGGHGMVRKSHRGVRVA